MLYLHGYVYSWILHLILTPRSSVPLLSVGPCLYLILCLSPLLTAPFIPMAVLLIKVCALAACSPRRNVCLYWISCYPLDEMAEHLHLGCSYDLHSSHPFVSTWGAVMLKQNKQTEKKHNRAIVSCTVLYAGLSCIPVVYNVMHLPSLSPSPLPPSFLPLLPPHCFYPGVDFFEKTIELEGKRIKLRIVYVI